MRALYALLLFLQLATTLPDVADIASTDATITLPDNGNSLAKREPRGRRRPPGRGKTRKYFKEPGNNDVLGHYDVRYYQGIVPYEEHLPVLQHLIRSYLTTFHDLGIETWLAHGTLLGWWWNGRIMPWDPDLDVQVSDVTLFYLAKNLNRTMHSYTYVNTTTGQNVTKNYLLDINPFHAQPRYDGQNIIDARWIDTTNGMFVDITGLAERDQRRRPGVWSCKNFHRYRTRELFPMRETEFEGVPAMIPYSFDKILSDEYGAKALVVTQWEHHEWQPDEKEWIKNAPEVDEAIEREKQAKKVLDPSQAHPQEGKPNPNKAKIDNTKFIQSEG